MFGAERPAFSNRARRILIRVLVDSHARAVPRFPQTKSPELLRRRIAKATKRDDRPSGFALSLRLRALRAAPPKALASFRPCGLKSVAGE